MYVVRITPADTGARVSIRRRAAGPLPLTDVVGELLSWADRCLTIRTRDGSIVRVAETDLVAGRRVPPQPVRRSSSGQAAGQTEANPQ
ncbi:MULTISPECIES: putative acetyltransferase [unclassified Frankia]|uniref:putative acetyltransferase n=1 Tax=unclassified Frankia TaxID=2632575 RepID=UPI0040449BDE